jgi:hypothetical protein
LHPYPVADERKHLNRRSGMKIFSDALSDMAGYGLKAYLLTKDICQIAEADGHNEKSQRSFKRAAGTRYQRFPATGKLELNTATELVARQPLADARGSLTINQQCAITYGVVFSNPFVSFSRLQ